MASARTNDGKRAEAVQIVAALEARGWTRPVLSAVIDQDIGPLARGKSMDTNDLRARLAALPAFHTSEALTVLKDSIVQAQARRDRNRQRVKEGRAALAAPVPADHSWLAGRSGEALTAQIDCIRRNQQSDLETHTRHAADQEKRIDRLIGAIQTR